MIAVSVFLRAELRQRWRSWVALALLAGMFCGTVGAVAAGARRTDSAYPDLLAWSDAPDVLIYSLASSSPTFARLPLAALARLPQTAQSATLADFSVVAPGTVVLVAPENTGSRAACGGGRSWRAAWLIRPGPIRSTFRSRWRSPRI